MIAREEKGLLGVDYNRGEKTVFTTSTRNREQGLEVRQDDPLLVRPRLDTAPGEERRGRQEAAVRGEDTVVPVYSDSQKSKTLVAGMAVELLMGVIVVVLVVSVVTVGIVYNCVRKKGPEKDLELNSSMYGDDEQEEEDSDEGEGDDEFEDTAKDTKKYDMMTTQNRTGLMRPMSVP